MSNEENTKKAREPKKNSIPFTEVEALIEGLPRYEKTSFLVVGHKDGVRIAVPLTTGVSRAYFYGNNDYSTVPDDDAIRVFSAEERKQERRGGIMAEIDFSQGLDAARRALVKMVDSVRNAPVPQPKPKKEPKAKVPTESNATAAGNSEVEQGFDESSDDDVGAEA